MRALVLVLPWLLAVAPWSLPEWRRAQAGLGARLDEAAALEEATTRLHNVYGPKLRTCAEDPEAFGARAARFGAAWGGAIDDAEARLARLISEANAPLVAPLLDQAGRDSLARLIERVEAARRRLDEAAAWHAKFVKECPLPMRPIAGVPRGPEETPRGRMAVIGVGGGRLCPADVPADGTPVVVGDEEQCADLGVCRCTPLPVDPGAIVF